MNLCRSPFHRRDPPQGNGYSTDSSLGITMHLGGTFAALTARTLFDDHWGREVARFTPLMLYRRDRH